MERLFLVTAPVEYDRHALEMDCYTNTYFTQKEVEDLMMEHLDFQLWDLQDFVEYCNDQKFDVESVWMQSIKVEVPDDYNPNRSMWYSNLIRF